MAKRIMILGALGQIGTDLVETLRAKHGNDNVLATDLRQTNDTSGPFRILNAKDKDALESLVDEFKPDEIYHMVAMLSATAEKKPMDGWELNMSSLFHVLELAKAGKVGRVFWPSSIAAFGPTSPKNPCPQTTVMDPTTVYGISKLSGELWCKYYHDQYDVDVRSIRYPGLISWKAEPGGGTTDYAVSIFYDALKNGNYTSFINEGTRLPMMYMPDAIAATIGLMEASTLDVKIRTSYNIGSFSFDPVELAQSIKKEMPDFTLSLKPDYRDEIAQGWPAVMDDKEAREHWGHDPKFSLDDMVKDMLKHISEKLS